MASIDNSKYYFPYFPLPPPHYPHHSPSPPNMPPSSNPPSPPKVAPPPPFPVPATPPSHSIPPPSPILKPPPHPISPPSQPHIVPPPPPFPKPATPPSHSIPPPSPIVRPPPPPHPISPPSPPHIVPPPPPTPGHHSTVIIVVFVSLGGLFFLAFLSVALCCFIKKKNKRMVQKDEVIKIDDHIKVQEAVIPGPHGEQQTIVLIEEDLHIQEDIKKTDIVSGSSHTKLPSTHHPRSIDVAAFSTDTSHRHIEHES